MDTKWKLLSTTTKNFGISQNDIYQMYAYSKKYNAKKIVLLYPQSDILRGEKIVFSHSDGFNVEVGFIDLLQPDESIKALI